MRIVTHLISLERLGGIEVNTLEAVRALVARGHEVHVLYGSPSSDTPMPLVRDELESNGVILHGPFPFTSTLQTALTAVAHFLPAARFVSRLRPDVIWLQRPEQIMWGQTVARLSRTPLVSHLHHAPNYDRALRFLNIGVRRFIAVSEFMSQHWQEAGIGADRIEVLLNAIPESSYPVGGLKERAYARRQLGLVSEVPTMLYYGRLEEGKGIAVILEAWEAINAAPDEAQLVLAGESPWYADPELMSKISEKVAQGTVRLLPSQSDVVPLLHAADVVLFPSLLQEAFGRVALEGLMTARPVLASRIGGVPEILTGSLATLLVPPDHPGALADGIADVMNWRRDDPELGTRCHQHAQTAFSFDNYVRRLEELLSAPVSHRRRTIRPSAARAER